MNPIKNNIYFLKVSLKIVVSIICYLIFTLYTIPAFNNVRAYVDEKMFTDKRVIVVGETPVIVGVVDTQEAREKGLSGKSELAEGTGMLFIFEEIGMHAFWMKDMNFSIDIIWFNEYGEVIYFVENISPNTYPAKYTSTQESLYVLEVPAGFIKKQGIKIGDKIDLY